MHEVAPPYYPAWVDDRLEANDTWLKHLRKSEQSEDKRKTAKIHPQIRQVDTDLLGRHFLFKEQSIKIHKS